MTYYKFYLIIFIFNSAIIFGQNSSIIELSDNFTKIIFQDHSGYLWVGTNNGLNKFNGYETKQFFYSPVDSNSISNDFVYTVFEDSSNTIWVGTRKGLNKYNPQTESFTRFYPNYTNSISSYSMAITSIVQIDNSLWLGTSGSGLIKFNLTTGDYRIHINDPDSTHDSSLDYINEIHNWSKDTLWMATYGGLVLFDINTQKFINYRPDRNDEKSIPHKRVNSIFKENDKSVLVATNGGGISRFDLNKNSFQNLTIETYEKRFNKFFSVKNTIYALDRNGKTYFVDENSVSLADKFQDLKITSFITDNNNVQWIGTADKGVKKLNSNSRFIKHKNFASKNQIISSSILIKNNLYLTDRSNFYKISFMKNNIYETKVENIFSQYPLSVEYNNNLIYGFVNGIKNLSTKDNILSQTEFKDLEKNIISELLFDDNSNYWVGTRYAGLFKINNSTYTNYNDIAKIENRISAYFITKLFEDSQKNIWVGTDNGLSLIGNDNKITNDFISTNSKNIKPQYILSIAEDNSNNIWIGTYGGGLFRFNPQTKQVSYSLYNNKIANHVINDIIAINNELWLSTNKGISIIELTDSTVINFDKTDGLPENKIYKSHFNDETNTLIFRYDKGIIYFDPNELNKNQTIPILQIENIFVGTNNYTHTKILLEKLQHYENSISFEYACMDFSNVNRNVFSYRLIGANDKWSSPTKENKITFANLSPGEYTFELKASNGYGVWSKPSKISFIINPAFYNTLWFRTTFFLIIIFVIALLIKRKQKQEIEKQNEIRRIRKKVADDFHDELGHKLTKISLLSRILKKNSEITKPETLNIVEDINKESDSLYDNTKDFIWSLNPSGDLVISTLFYIKDFGDEFFRNTEIDFYFVNSIDENSQAVFNTETKRELIIIFKELMHNTLKHSGANKVEIISYLNENNFALELIDNGKGFDITKKYSGNGLNNIKIRASKLDAELLFNSSNGNTQVKFEIEL